MLEHLCVLLAGLNICGSEDELGAERSIILKLVVNTQGNNLDFFEL
jgi:hypothetical protein